MHDARMHEPRMPAHGHMHARARAHAWGQACSCMECMQTLRSTHAWGPCVNAPSLSLWMLATRPPPSRSSIPLRCSLLTLVDRKPAAVCRVDAHVVEELLHPWPVDAGQRGFRAERHQCAHRGVCRRHVRHLHGPAAVAAARRLTARQEEHNVVRGGAGWQPAVQQRKRVQDPVDDPRPRRVQARERRR
eukprot:353394-Chlamydomonas_euryale.AAC.13